MTKHLQRCSWAETAPDFPEYHDNEWGIPVADDNKLFEKLCLETFQSGLSWRTILTKREAFRLAFDQFDCYQMAQFDDDKVAQLLANKHIIRNQRKILAVINNAQRAIELIEQEGSLAHFLWRYEPTPSIEIRTQCAESVALAKELKKRGWTFLGPTTLYAFMQSMGMVNDHETDCHCHDKIEGLRSQFQRPNN
ncbi:DNA-3-methyladenine glycosylase I [Marinomonas sp. THO17]|uniref:DNA-3-methyladenine glycosylase I n=1 Tax=Marinomonas sp. THO17 TaxID=3149048 RepID=UPI00336BE183